MTLICADYNGFNVSCSFCEFLRCISIIYNPDHNNSIQRAINGIVEENPPIRSFNATVTANMHKMV